MKKINFLVMLLLVATVSAQAQVTIGDLKNPEPFSILELVSDRNDNGYRGLRLPQLTTEERKAMQETDDFQNEKNDNAMGLQIYNTTTRCVETWNGSGWIQSCGEDGPRPATGEVAYLEGGVIKYRDFMSYNLGAQEISIKEQLLHVSPTTNAIPSTNEQKTAYAKVYGSLYQWGHQSDGHENVWSTVTANDGVSDANIDDATGQVLEGEDEYGLFIKGSDATKYDWYTTTGSANYWNRPGRWDGKDYSSGTPTFTPFAPNSKVTSDKGVDPCPAGFRVPSQVEWAAIFTGGSWSSGVNSGGINKWVWVAAGSTLPAAAIGIDLDGQNVGTSGYLIYPAVGNIPSYTYSVTPTLFLPAAGYRSYSDGILYNGGSGGFYWNSTAYSAVGIVYAYYLRFFSGTVSLTGLYRATGMSVRCVAD